MECAIKAVILVVTKMHCPKKFRAQRHFSKKSQHFFSSNFFFNFKNCLFLKSSESYSKKSDEKKKMLATFCTFQIDHISKTKNRKIVFFCFSFFSIHNPSFRIIKSPLRIIKSKRLFLRGGRSLTRKGPIY